MAKNEFITTPASIQKREITPLHGHVGEINATSELVGGVTYPPGQLRFEGFAGRIDLATRLYRGVLRFTPGPHEGNRTKWDWLAEVGKKRPAPVAAPTPVAIPKKGGA